MSPGRATKGLLLANVLCSLCALPLVDIPPTMAFTFGGLLLPAFYSMGFQAMSRGYNRVWGAVAVALVLASGIEFIISGKPPEQVLSFQIVCLVLCRVYTVQTVRHLYHLPVLTFLLMLVTGIAGGSMLFPLIFLFYVATLAPLLVALLAVEEQQLAEESSISDRGNSASRLSSNFRHNLAFSVAGLAATIVVFSALPRLGSDQASSADVQGGYHTGTASTGLSEFLTLDRLSSLKQDMTEVMRVRVLGSAFTEDQLYLKGYVLEDFRPQTVQWRRIPEQDQKQVRVDGSRVELPLQADEPQSSVILVTQEITLAEPALSGVLFGLSGLREVSGITGSLRLDPSGNCTFRAPEGLPVTGYQVYSDYAKQFTPRSASSMRLVRESPKPERCLDYPDGGMYDRIKTLAQGICSQARAVSPRAKALAIQKHLISGYQYRIEGRSLRSRNPLESFLFRHKKGHCELFAGAMALMLRSCSVPSRIVLGYHGGSFDADTSEFVIRQSDAHAWVEAFLPGAGWVAFDPTPPVPMQSYGERIAFKFIKDAADRVALQWQKYFGDNKPVPPDTVGLLRWLGAFVFANKAMSHPVLVDAFERFSDAAADRRFRLLAISLGVVNLAAILLVLVRGRRKRRPVSHSSLVSDQVLKAILRRMAGSRSRRIPRGVTAREFILQIAIERYGNVPGALEELMATYHEIRFSACHDLVPDWKQVQRCLNELPNTRT